MRNIQREGLVRDTEAQENEICIFKTFNLRTRFLKNYGKRDVAWVVKFYGNCDLKLAYRENKTKELTIIAGVRTR